MTPGAALGEGGIVLYLWLISQQTFRTAPVRASELFSRSGRGEVQTLRGICGGIEEGGLINAAGMLQECWIGLLRDGLFNPGRCGPGENHGIVVPNLACTFSVPCRHSSGKFSAVWK